MMGDDENSDEEEEKEGFMTLGGDDPMLQSLVFDVRLSQNLAYPRK